MLYNINYDVCAAIIYLFTMYCIISKKGVTESQNRLFVVIIIDGILMSIFDILGAIMISYPHQYSEFMRDATNYVFLFLYNMLPLMFCIYVVFVSGISLRKTGVIFNSIVMLPFVFNIVVLCLNPIFKWVFYFDEQLVYKHGFMMNLLYVSAFIYIGTGVYFIIKYRKAIQKNRVMSLMYFVAACIISVIIQYFNRTLLIQLFIQSLAFLGVLFTTENKDQIMNATTGIYNRRAFIDENIKLIESNTEYYVISLRFTNLKYYLSSLGVVRINKVVKEVAVWLNSISTHIKVYDGENGVFAFVINMKNQKLVPEILDMLRRKFAEDWQSEDINIAFNTQICAVHLPEQADTLEKLLALIDTDYVIVESKVSVLTNDDIKYLQREIDIEKAIRRALEKRSFKVFYQPIWDKKTDTIHSAEALIRLFDDEIGNIPPDEFIPVSEKNGTIGEIGEFVFEQVCRLFSERHIEQLGIEFVEVNLSTVQCMERNLPFRFDTLLQKYGVSSDKINLEITESAAANSPEMFMLTMNMLRSMGFTFSMDDYGTGYSNFSYMFDHDFKIIKLDKSILWNADKNKNARIILKNTILMLKEMELNIVMEGVETEEQKNYVSDLGCDYCQGYYFSKPVDEDKFIDYCCEYNKVCVTE